jgi:hypothetical protein
MPVAIGPSAGRLRPSRHEHGQNEVDVVTKICHELSTHESAIASLTFWRLSELDAIEPFSQSRLLHRVDFNISQAASHRSPSGQGLTLGHARPNLQAQFEDRAIGLRLLRSV